MLLFDKYAQSKCCSYQHIPYLYILVGNRLFCPDASRLCRYGTTACKQCYKSSQLQDNHWPRIAANYTRAKSFSHLGKGLWTTHEMMF